MNENKKYLKCVECFFPEIDTCVNVKWGAPEDAWILNINQPFKYFCKAWKKWSLTPKIKKEGQRRWIIYNLEVISKLQLNLLTFQIHKTLYEFYLMELRILIDGCCALWVCMSRAWLGTIYIRKRAGWVTDAEKLLMEFM